MFEVIFLLFICVCTWLSIQAARSPRRKSKVKQVRPSIIEQLFGVPFYLWLCMRLWPEKILEEIQVTIQTESKKARTERTLQYVQRESGLWVPAR